MKVVVVGAGIAGLTAGYRLAGAADVTVLEASTRCGGKLAGIDLDGVGLDGGAESMLARRPEAIALAGELGLELVHPTTAKPGVLIEGRRRSLPPSVQGVPSDVAALGELLTARGWERARREPQLPAPELTEDVGIGAYVDQRFGSEVTDRLLEPLLAGVYAGRSRELSFAAVAAGLWQLARQGGSLTAAAAELARDGSAGPVFAGIVGGVHGLASALRDRLPDVRTGVTVRELRRSGRGYELEVGPTTAPQTVSADAVVLACPAAPAARLLSGLGGAVPSAGGYGAIPYASVAVITVAVRGAELEGSGLLLPPGERPTIKAVTHSSRKWDWIAAAARERWGDGVEVARLSVGRLGEAASLQSDDDTLLSRTFAEAQTLPGWGAAELVSSSVSRWGGGLPQYRVGHRDLVAALRAELAELPGLAVCGAALDGLGIAACVASGDRAARELMEDWSGD